MAFKAVPRKHIMVLLSGILSACLLISSSPSTTGALWGSSVTEMVYPAERNQVTTISVGIYRRALEESLGYFDDIPEEKWMRRKNIAVSQNHTEIDAGSDPEWYYSNWHPDFHCEFEDFIGYGGDGGKWVCDPHRLLKKDCLVYSVGSNGKFDFEQHVLLALPHCEVHIFDFTDYTEAMNVWGENGVNASFHAWGLGSNDGTTNVVVKPNSPPVVFKSFRETVQELGHEGRAIDIFKIDCEGCEWISYLDWFNDSGILGMRQILVETHAAPKGKAQSFFEYLHNKGYVIFHKEPNIQYGGGKCIEFAFLQLNETFFSN